MKLNKASKIAFLIAYSLIISNFSIAQRVNLKDSVIAISMMDVHVSLQTPGGDMKTRFGNNISLGVGFMRKTNKNFLWGAEVNYIAGADVKEKYVLDSLKTSRGQFINTDGNFSDVRTFERGFSTYAKIGKVFPILSPNKNSGIMVMAGLGFIQHKIHIEVLNENVPALNEEYRKGYDRLTNGISIHEFIGYYYLSQSNRLNFYAGFDFSQSFTQNRRDWDFFAQKKLDEQRKDYLNGFKFGFVIPIYKRMPREFYFR